MTQKEKVRLLNKHRYHNSLTYRLFAKHPPHATSSCTDHKIEIHSLDDEVASYPCLLDNVKSKEELMQGLTELSPFADDALEIAREMSDDDFVNFKRALVLERRGEHSNMPSAYYGLMLPTNIVHAMFLAREAGAPLGTVLIRILEVELGM